MAKWLFMDFLFSLSFNACLIIVDSSSSRFMFPASSIAQSTSASSANILSHVSLKLIGARAMIALTWIGVPVLRAWQLFVLPSVSQIGNMNEFAYTSPASRLHVDYMPTKC